MNPLWAAALVIAFTLQGCASKSEDLYIRHDLLPLSHHSGLQKFDYTMTWYLPPAQMFGSERKTIIANLGLSSKRTGASWIVLDNETKLKLEDVAIKGLEKELRATDICLDGYKIESTKWLERSIQFTGYCL